MGTGTVYVCDTTALLDIHQHFPKKFRKLKKLVEQDKLRIPESVARELERRSKKVGEMIRNWAESYQRLVVVIGRDHRLREEVPRIEVAYGEKVIVGQREYPGFWHSPAGRKAADAQVVAVGKVFRWTVVSDDRAVRFACSLENVECIGWSEFARRAGIGSETGQPEFQFQ
jgi:rRNA-processing protein FCF1